MNARMKTKESRAAERSPLCQFSSKQFALTLPAASERVNQNRSFHQMRSGRAAAERENPSKNLLGWYAPGVWLLGGGEHLMDQALQEKSP